MGCPMCVIGQSARSLSLCVALATVNSRSGVVDTTLIMEYCYDCFAGWYERSGTAVEELVSMHDDAPCTSGAKRRPSKATVPPGWPDTLAVLLARYLPEGERWYRGEFPPLSECAPAMPGVWTAGTVVGVIGGVVDDRSSDLSVVAARLVSDAQLGMVTRESTRNVFGQGDRTDISGTASQFMVAGLIVSA